MIETGLLDSSRAADALGVVGIPVDLKSGIGRGLEQQRHVLRPIAGNDGVGPRCLDLGNVG